MKDENTVGMFFHSEFPMPGWGHRDMGFTGWQCCLDWARSLGINTAIFFVQSQLRCNHPEWSWIEQERMYHSLVAGRPKFMPGDIYWEKDPLLSTPESRRNAELRKKVMLYAARIGMRTRLTLFSNLGAPSFVQAHPEYQAIDAGDFSQEGLGLSPKHPEAVDHLMEFWGSVMDFYPPADSYLIWMGDPGGCCSREVENNPQININLINEFYKMIRSKRAEAGIVMSTWHVRHEHLTPLLNGIPKDIVLTVPPGIHVCEQTPDEYAAKIRLYRQAGFHVEAWLETTENVTFLMPACYPKRIGKFVDVLRDCEVKNISLTGTIYPYVFTLNNLVAARMACDPEATAAKVTEDYLVNAFGKEALPATIDHVDSLEAFWTAMVGPHQATVFPGRPWHTCFISALFPLELMQNAPSKELVAEIDAMVTAAESAVESARRMAACTWQYHAMDTNLLLVSAELLMHWARFRKAQLPVFEAIRANDLPGAVTTFERLTDLAESIVTTAGSAPNTLAASEMWMKFHLLPERLEAVRMRLPELVERKSVRSLEWRIL